MLKYLFTIVCVAIISNCSNLAAQTAPNEKITIDTNYLADHANDLILRVYGSNKFTKLSFGDYGQGEKVVYKPNSNYNIGVGFNYKFLGINLGFRTPVINDDNDKYGKTKYLDLQAYVYARKMTIDFYGQTYEGYYQANKNVLKNQPANQEYLIRSDIQTRNLGGNFEYIFNNKHFSYRAVYVQNERQKRSAGSFLLGAGVHYLNVRADSAIIPKDLANAVINGNEDFNRYSVGSLAINGGYAHTFVIQQKFFIMGSLLLGVGADYTQFRDKSSDANTSHFSYHTNGILRLGAGYNSERYYAGIYFTTNMMGNNLPLASGNSYQQYETGVLRVAVARRFTKIPKAVRIIDKVGNWLGGK